MQARFLQGLGPVPPVLGLAISGGGDSVALLMLAVGAGIDCRAVTVDHGLRAGSAAEAADVASLCARHGIPHRTLHWHWDGAGNLPDAARRARRRLMAEWAVGEGVGHIALGHTRDDVAETFLMRLARGAGLDGLSAMQGSWTEQGVTWHRPLLQVGREELRDYLRASGVPWAEDPSNSDPAYDRSRARAALSCLPLGLTTERLAEVAGHLAKARTALEAATDTAARRHIRIDHGDVLIDPEGLDPEMVRRLLLRAVAWIGHNSYPPRGASVTRAMDALRLGQPAAVQGCGMVAQRGAIRVYREWAAVRRLSGPVDRPWDRWRLSGPVAGDLHIAALGAAGLRHCPAWRGTGLPRRSLVSSPAVWRGEMLVAAPLAGLPNGWTAVPDRPSLVLSD